jgi:hypothetical protein
MSNVRGRHTRMIVERPRLVLFEDDDCPICSGRCVACGGTIDVHDAFGGVCGGCGARWSAPYAHRDTEGVRALLEAYGDVIRDQLS